MKAKILKVRLWTNKVPREPWMAEESWMAGVQVNFATLMENGDYEWVGKVIIYPRNMGWREELKEKINKRVNELLEFEEDLIDAEILLKMAKPAEGTVIELDEKEDLEETDGEQRVDSQTG